MKTNKKTKSQTVGQQKGISCNPLSTAINNFGLPLGINFRLAPLHQFHSALPSCQLFRSSQAALLGLAHLEAQLILNQLGNHNTYLNPFLPSFLQAFQNLQNAANLSLYQPPRPAVFPVLKNSNAHVNPASEDVFSLDLKDGMETTKAKHQSDVSQQQKLDSSLSKDKKVPPSLGLDQMTQAVMSYTVHPSVNQRKTPRTVPLSASSTYKSRKDWRKPYRGSAHSKRNHHTSGLRDKHHKEWQEHHSPSHSVSPTPSWSPSPPPFSHQIRSQSPQSSGRYSPSDLVYGSSSSEHGPSEKKGEHPGHENLTNKHVDVIKRKVGPNPNGKGQFKKKKATSSVSVACFSDHKYPSSKTMDKDKYKASTFMSSSSSVSNSKTHTSMDASSRNVQQIDTDIIKKEKDLGDTVVSPKCHLGLPAEAKYQDVCHSLAPFGAVKEQKIFPGLEKLSTVSNLVVHTYDWQGKVQIKQPVGSMDSGEACLITPPTVEGKKGVICISGIPFNHSEGDLIKLVKPFGKPIKILIANEIDLVNGLDWRKALVVLSSELSAMEIVKVYSVVPVHLREYDVTLAPQAVDFSSTVSLFQALITPTYYNGSLIPCEHLLVVRNIPDHPHISTDVLQQVQLFGKALRVLVLPEEKTADHRNVLVKENTHCVMMIFEMKSSVNVLEACEWFQKSNYIFNDHRLQFSMWMKPQKATSGVIANSKSWKRQMAEEHWGLKHNDTSPWIPESVEGVLVFISGFPDNMDSEDGFIQIAAPHGIPTNIVIAAAQRKALVELPDKDSAKKMVMAYNAIPVGLKQLDMKLLPKTVDINNPVSLFQVIMGPENHGEDVPDPLLLITVANVPDTLSGISQVQQLIQAYGAVNRTLILSNNMIIFEMKTSEMARLAYEQLKKLPYTVQKCTLSFFWGSSQISETTKEGDVPIPAQRPETSIQHFSCCVKKGMQAFSKTQGMDECERNMKRSKKAYKREGRILQLQSEVGNQVKNQKKTKEPEKTGKYLGHNLGTKHIFSGISRQHLKMNLKTHVQLYNLCLCSQSVTKCTSSVGTL
ncbi:uncharacterized protein si:ch211-89o9.4 [Astyanax mexicanus]|uniref:uncharacterized protein si:ch211-89o9.4 n=1 Tax=Astyanax mexicanus TaxID=7994 RepID=UPI0020CB3EA6|nr:uncharacterized protein si:ch211-89o9.4 [Astyanax mexicanus]